MEASETEQIQCPNTNQRTHKVHWNLRSINCSTSKFSQCYEYRSGWARHKLWLIEAILLKWLHVVLGQVASLTQGKKSSPHKTLSRDKLWWGKTLTLHKTIPRVCDFWISSNVWASACYIPVASLAPASPGPHCTPRIQVQISLVHGAHQTEIPGSIHPYKVLKINYTFQLLPRVPNCQRQSL